MSGSKRYWNPNPKNPKPTLEIKSEAYETSIFDENRNQMLKDRNSANRNEPRIPKTEFFWHKNRYKNTKKSQWPGPSRMNRTVQSTNHTNDNTKTIIIAETSTKTFFKIFLVFQSETCCETTLVTRYFFREGVMSRNRIIHRLRISMLDTL